MLCTRAHADRLADSLYVFCNIRVELSTPRRSFIRFSTREHVC